MCQHDKWVPSYSVAVAGNVRLGYQVWEQSPGACRIFRSRDLGPANSKGPALQQLRNVAQCPSLDLAKADT